jgi:geranylgeranyl diphosphate synthase type I
MIEVQSRGNEQELHSSLQLWARYRDQIRLELEAIVNTLPQYLANIIRYHMGWADEKGRPCQRKSGKYIRSILHLVCCQAVGGDVTQVTPSAATVEFVHNFSLIHDDVQDGSHERHGRPTVWKLWGKSQAINIGDLMFSLASLSLVRLKEKGVPSDKVVFSFRFLAEACEDLCEGQYLDIAYEKRLDVTVEEYLTMIRKKTAALIAASTFLGAYLGGGENKASHFGRFGEALGLAYQIRDDILGIWGKRETTGKSVEEDIQRKKKTLPVVYALRECKEREKLRDLYAQKQIRRSDIASILEILDRSGAQAYAQGLVEQYHRQALEWLDACNVKEEHLFALRKIAYFLVRRQY